MCALVEIGSSADENAIRLGNYGPAGSEDALRFAEQTPHMLSYVRADRRQNDCLRFDKLENQLSVNVAHGDFTVSVTDRLVLKKSSS